MTPEINQRIQLLRQRMAANEPISMEEMKEAVAIMREGRLSSAYSADATKRKKAMVAIPKAQDMLSELDDME